MENQHKQDLELIRSIMYRSSRFISLSGLSGIIAGIIALGAAYGAHALIFAAYEPLGYEVTQLPPLALTRLLVLTAATLILAIGAIIVLTTRATRKQHHKIWDATTKRVLLNLAIPLFTGGIVSLILLLNGFVALVIPLTLIFYGLALVNVSKYTLDEMRSLGLLEIIIGILGLYFIEFALLFWAIGFGVLHIVYGAVMYRKVKS